MTTHRTQELLGDLLFLCERSLSLSSNNLKNNELISSLKNELMPLWERCIRSTKEYKVIIVGLGNVGKSTLLNAILEMKVAPTCNAACTAQIVEFRYGCEFRIVAHVKDRILPEETICSCPEELYGVLSTMVAHQEENEREKEWDKISVYVPADILNEGLILADTPGFGAAADIGQNDDKIISEFLQNDVAQIFWVVMADQGIGSQELSFYNTFIKNRCDDLIVTNGEDWDENDRSRWKHRFLAKLKKTLRIQFIEGKKAINGDADDRLKSGVPAVCDRIRELRKTEGRLELVDYSINLLGEAFLQQITSEGHWRHLFCPIESAKICKKYFDKLEMASWIKILKNYQ